MEPATPQIAMPITNTTIAQEANKFKISSKNINVARLRDAGEQAEKVLVRNLQVPLIKYLREEYKKCAKASFWGGINADFASFRQFLLEIHDWNAVQIETAAKHIIGNGAFKYYETLKFLLVAKVFLMASVRSFEGNDNSALSMPMPTLNDYIHRVLYLISRELYIAPSLIRLQTTSYEVQAATSMQLLNQLVERSIKDAIIDLVPHDHIMDTYLGDTLKGLSFEMSPALAETTPIPVPEPTPAPVFSAPVAPTTSLADSVVAPVKLADIVALEQKKPDEAATTETTTVSENKSDNGSDAESDNGVELSSSESDSEDEKSAASSASETETESESESESESEAEKKKKKKNKKKEKKEKPKKKKEKKTKKDDHHKTSTRQVKVPKEEKA
jgi:hypothetical protein